MKFSTLIVAIFLCVTLGCEADETSTQTDSGMNDASTGAGGAGAEGGAGGAGAEGGAGGAGAEGGAGGAGAAGGAGGAGAAGGAGGAGAEGGAGGAGAEGGAGGAGAEGGAGGAGAEGGAGGAGAEGGAGGAGAEGGAGGAGAEGGAGGAGAEGGAGGAGAEGGAGGAGAEGGAGGAGGMPPVPGCVDNGECPNGTLCIDNRCVEGCVCQEIYAPVCGANGQTYDNECFAACEGVDVVDEGECPPMCPTEAEYCRALCADELFPLPDGCELPPCECGAGMCGAEEFECAATRVCIPELWRCDAEEDCQDGSDEVDCEQVVCAEGLFDCGNGQCRPARDRCDGFIDCANERDEQNCEEQMCPDGAAYCNAVCSMEAVDPLPPNCPEIDCGCDLMCQDENDPRVTYESFDPRDCLVMNFDCPEGAERFDDDCGCGCLAEEFICGEGDFQCGDGQCIRGDWVCDFVVDCDNGSDEPPVRDDCGIEACVPEDGWIDAINCMTGECIEREWICDGMVDCLSGEDELDCD